MPPIPMDTSPAADHRQFEIWQGMTPLERAELANQMSIDVAAFAVAGIRAQFPDAAEARVRYELCRRRYGSALADAAFGPTADG